MSAEPAAPTRHRLLELKSRNVKCLREVEITFGDVTEIRGDTGQGKTAILDSITAALRGIDPDMVRQGEDAAEIVLHLDSVRIQRIMQANGKKSLTVTDPTTGQKIDKGEAFLTALFPSALPFSPIEFAQLGGGEKKGKTERLRAQRDMLLNSMPMRLDFNEAVASVKDLGEEHLREISGIDLADVDWNQHALAVCESLQKTVYEARKEVNAAADSAEATLAVTPAPALRAPDLPLAECRAAEEKAARDFYSAEANAKAREGTVSRRGQLVADIAREGQSLPSLTALQNIRATFPTALADAESRIATLRAQLATAEEALAALRTQQQENSDKIARHTRIAEWKSELAQIDSTLGGEAGADVNALRQTWEEAKLHTQARDLQDKRDAAHAKAEVARHRADVYTALVELFRDELPRQIIERMKMPVPGLGISEGVVTFNGIPLHQLGTSEQIRVAVMVAAAINPHTGFMLIDGAESMGSKDKAELVRAAGELGICLVMTYVDPTAVPGEGRVVMRAGEVVR